MFQANDGGGGGYSAGPKEQELIKIFSFYVGDVKESAKQWSRASEGILQVSKDVESAMNDLGEHWSGPASAAAQDALKKLKANLVEHSQNLDDVHKALTVAATTADTAQTNYGKLPPASITDASKYNEPVQGPTPDGTPMTKFDDAAYEADLAEKRRLREEAAATYVAQMNEDMRTAGRTMGYTPRDDGSGSTGGGGDDTTGSGAGGGYDGTGGWASSYSASGVGGSTGSSAGGGSSGFSGGNTGSVSTYNDTTGWNTSDGESTLGVAVPGYPGQDGGDYLTSVDGGVTGTVPGGDGFSGVSGAAGGVSGTTSGTSGLAGAAGLGGVVAGGAGALMRGGGGGAGGLKGLSGLAGGGARGLSAAALSGSPTPGGASGGGVAGRGAAGRGAAGGRGGVPGVSGTGGAGGAGGTSGAGGTAAVAAGGAGGRGGMAGAGGAGAGAGGSTVKGASSGGRYGVPKLDGAGGRGGSSGVVAAGGERGAADGKAAGGRGSGASGAAGAGGAGGRGSGERQVKDKDHLTHEDEDSWYEDSEASPAVWQD